MEPCADHRMFKNTCVAGMVLLLAILYWGCKKDRSDVTPRWHQVASADGGFTVLMPGKPLEKQKILTWRGIGAVPAHFFMTDTPEGVGYSVIYYDYRSKFVADEGSDRILDHRRDSDLASVKGRLASEEHISLGTHPGRRITITGKQGRRSITLKSRLFMVETRLYALTVIASDDALLREGADKFFGSFKLQSEDN